MVEGVVERDRAEASVSSPVSDEPADPVGHPIGPPPHPVAPVFEGEPDRLDRRCSTALRGDAADHCLVEQLDVSWRSVVRVGRDRAAVRDHGYRQVQSLSHPGG